MRAPTHMSIQYAPETKSHWFTAVKPMKPDNPYGPDAQIRVEAGLHWLSGNSRPYFSVTGEIFIPERSHIEAGGCLHREILEYWPELSPVVALHLSDGTGVPMHAEANGWYWLAGYYGGAGEAYHGGNGEGQHWLPDGTFDGYRKSTQAECLNTWATHCRLSLVEAKVLAEAWRRAAPGLQDGTQNLAKIRPMFWRPYVQHLRTQWKQQCQAGIAVLDRLRGEVQS